MFKRWGTKKYSTKEDWLFVAERVKERKAHGRESTVKMHEEVVSTAKLKKQISRYGCYMMPYKRPILSNYHRLILL